MTNNKIGKMTEKRENDFLGLYCITAEKYSLGRNNIEVVKSLVAAGVKIIQYREKEKNAREKYIECLEIRRITKQEKVLFVVNDNVDIALAVKADGVHIGQDDMPVQAVRKIIGNKMLIGVSTHSSDQAIKAEKDGADYIGAGPVFATKTKSDVCDAVGLEYIDFVAKNIKIPFVAIGGIKLNNLEMVLSRGARCVAMVTEVVGAPDIFGMVNDVNELFEKSGLQIVQ